MIKLFFFVFILASALCSGYVHATVEAGVEFDDSIQLANGDKLVLNGTGIRSKWVIKVYAAGLYLPEKTTDVETILTTDKAKYIRMVFLRKVSQKRLVDTVDKGFRVNHTTEQLAAFEAELEEFKSLFKTVKKGDEVVIDYQPSIGTRLFGNGELQGTISGFEFNQAILRVWLGEVPADKKLKAGFLGRKTD